MTAQIPDTYIFHEDEYRYVASEPRFDFTPRSLGLEPESISSACWRGFFCTYEISEKGFKLKDFYVHTKDDKYPSIDNNAELISHVGIRGIAGTITKEKNGYRYYKDVYFPIDFTGSILVGKGFLKHYYLHLGYQRFYTYETLIEIVIANGKVVKMLDRSEIAKLCREKIDAVTEEIDYDTDIDSIIKQIKEENSIGEI